MAPPTQRDGASPASTALSVVSDPPADAQPILEPEVCSDPDVHNKPVIEPVAEMSTAPEVEVEDEPQPLPDTGVPTVRITEAPASPITASSPRQSTQTDPLPHASAPQRASLSAATGGSSSQNRSRRATMDARSSNRLSGFFSQLLTARRNDVAPPMPSPTRRDRSASPPASPAAQNSPPPRPSTPPPSLAPPTLSELGLSLSVLNSGLSAAQYATPPTSGTFLAPHYLLLCHAQGLDVFPLVGPPVSQPYALVRRVAFKSVIVMEERGVLVAIAGRRDGVRVYALEEVRRAVEWRLDLEVKREAENTRRSRELANKGKIRASVQPGVNMPASSSAPSALGPSQPEPEPEPPAQPPLPLPPSYASSVEHRPLITRVSTTNLAAVANAHGRTRGGSLSSVVGLSSQSPMHALARASGSNGQQKSDWGEAAPSDDEALVAAGPEASAALDERTSSGGQAQAQPPVAAVASPPLQIGGTARRATVSNGADSATLSSMRTALAHSRSNNLLPRAPTLQQSELNAGGSDGISFAEMLRESRLPPPDVVPNPAVRRASVVMLQSQSHPVFTGNELDQVNEDTDRAQNEESPRPRRWSFVAPSTASLPDPVTNTQPPTPGDQRPATLPSLTSIPLPPSSPSVVSRSQPPPSPRPGSHRSTRSHPLPNNRAMTPPIPAAGPSRRRLLPKLFGAFGGGKKDRDRSRDRAGTSGKGTNGTPDAGSSSGGPEGAAGGAAAAPKLEYIKLPGTKGAIMIKAVETAKKSFLAILCGESGEKVELFAGTYRTALGLSRTFILPDSPKNLELQLQGDDLVEVFLVFAQNVFGLEPATVRVREVRIGRNERRAARRRARAGGAQSERREIEPTVVTTTVSVGDDLPPPAAGTSSRRSASLARRRREVSGRVTHNPNGDVAPPLPPNSPGPSTPNPPDPVLVEEMAALTTAQAGAYTTFQQLSFAPAFPLASIADDYIIPPTYLSFCEYRDQWEPDAERVIAAPRESQDETGLVVVKRGDGGKDGEVEQAGEEDESPRASGSGPRRQDSLEDDPAHALQFRPPTPPPQPTVVKWFYLDPKGVVQGPWKPSIMQNWLREGYLPPELPVRRADETEYTLLRDLRLQVEDPAEPFKPVQRPPPPPPQPETEPEPEPEPETTPQATEPEEITTTVEVIHGATTPAAPTAEDSIPPFGPTKALLKPISLLAQPRHFGPPALFYCSRGGHSTTVVDARGRAVLKGRIHWSSDNSMGDTQRVEAFDVDGRAVLVALRQGGIEATDVGQALLEPADESRTALPNYKVAPGAISRRSPYVWRLGTAVTSAGRPVGSTNGKRRAGGTGASGKKRTASSKQNGSSHVAIHANDSGDESDIYIAPEEEVIFLAREQDNVYVCERSAGKFRLLRLSKTNPTAATGGD
ncbi:GYF domain-containing protein mpd2 [Ceratobasidium sp. AG-Ba]|nr:GYF domain-containing protein mpd2 [Ceratobasidium sp. AG-Ba]